MQMRMRLTGQRELAARLKATPAQVRRATRRTVRQITNELHKELGGTIPKKASTSVMGFRRVRAKKKTPKGRGRVSRGNVWLGTNKIAAAYVKGVKRNDEYAGGAWAGEYFFENAFVATVKNGYTSIFKRIKGTRKLKEEYVHLPDATNDAKRAANKAELRLRKTLRKNLELEMSKKR